MSGRVITYREALGEALREAFERDERVLLMGQDIGVRGGSFGVTAGLLEAFGPARVRDAPSSEAALVGLGIGAALSGMRPVVELTTAAYATLALDQLIHHAAPLRALSGGRLSAPLVLRMPQGGGAARLGPVHSQTLEALLHHIPGLVVAVPATPADAKGLLAAAIASDDPVVVLEHTALYDTRGVVEEADAAPLDRASAGSTDTEAGSVAPLGRAVVRRPGSDVTVVASSRMAIVAEAAAAQLADEHGVDVEVIDLRTVRPLDHATIAASVRRTGRAVVVEEGWPDGGIGATLAARVAPATPGRPIVRVTGADVAVPYARTLAALAIPDEAAIVAAVLKVIGTRHDGHAADLATERKLGDHHDGPATDATTAHMLDGPHDGPATAVATEREPIEERRADEVTDHIMSTEIDMEALLDARRNGLSLADAISADIADLVDNAVIVLPDGSVTLLGAPHPPHPTTTLTFGPITTRPTAHAGAVTIHHVAPLTLRTTATLPDAQALLAALRGPTSGRPCRAKGDIDP